MPAKAGQIVIDVTLGTSQFVQDLEKAKGKIHEFASSSVSEGKAVRAMFKDMEGDITNNSRAAEAFAEEFLNAGTIAKYAFPVTAGLAFGGMMVDLIGKGKEWVSNFENGAAKIRNAFLDVANPLRQTNDELAVTNARLANDIAKLEGKPQNNLKVMLAEAVEQADKLAASTEKVLSDLNKLVKDKNVSSWWGLLGRAGTGDVKDEFGGETGSEGFLDRIRDLNVKGADAVRAATNAKSAEAAQTALNRSLTEAYGKEIEKVNGLLEKANQLQQQHDHPAANTNSHIGMNPALGAAEVPADQANRIAILKGILDQLKQERDYIDLSATNAALTGQKSGLSGDESGRRQALETTARLTKELADARAAQADSLERITIEENAELNALADANQLTDQNVALVREAYDTKRLTEYNRLMDLYAKGLDEAAKRYESLAVSSEKAFGDMFAADIKAGVTQLEQGAKAADAWAKSYNKITADIDSESLRHRVSLAGVGGNSNDPLGTLALQQSIERADIEARYAEKVKGEVSDQVRSIALRTRELELQKLQDQMEEQVAEHRHKNLRDFMVEMQGQSKNAGDILYDGAHEALDKLSDDIGNLVTHPKKTNVSQMFGDTMKSIGGDMTKEATKALMQKGLGALGKLFGIKAPAGKPDGTQGNPFYVVVEGMKGNGLGGNPLDGMAPNLPPAAGGKTSAGVIGGIAGAVGGFIGSLFGKGGGTAVDSSITYMAGGGDMEPGNIYGLAEKGEAEIVSPKYSSRVTPVSKLGGGETHYHDYHVDARGSDLGSGHRVERAVQAAHNAAVSNSVRAVSEHSQRTPKRKN